MKINEMEETFTDEHSVSEWIAEEITTENLRLVKHLCSIFLVTIVMAIGLAVLREEPLKYFYFDGATLVLLVGILRFSCSKSKLVRRAEKFLILLVELMLYSYGILVGTVICEPKTRMVTYAVLIAFVPILFVEKTSVKIATSTVSMLIFVVLDVLYKDPNVTVLDIGDSFIFCLIGLIAGVMLCKSRIGNIKGKILESKLHLEADSYNQKLNDIFLYSIGDMIESRDENTGGHVKRTSEVVRLLVEEMKKEIVSEAEEKKLDYVIKAAPLHDVGKVTIDDAILRKPGKYSEEEFKIMQGHTVAGGQIVKNLMKDVEDREQARVAENVAHYHHERFDGNGYPEGLSGSEIPMEARIMAIADVYDALVSKRCYKDGMSFQDVFDTIEKGMGTQFDPALNRYFIACRYKIERYYLVTKKSVGIDGAA